MDMDVREKLWPYFAAIGGCLLVMAVNLVLAVRVVANSLDPLIFVPALAIGFFVRPKPWLFGALIAAGIALTLLHHAIIDYPGAGVDKLAPTLAILILGSIIAAIRAAIRNGRRPAAPSSAQNAPPAAPTSPPPADAFMPWSRDKWRDPSA